jgi:hypothetical protein
MMVVMMMMVVVMMVLYHAVWRCDATARWISATTSRGSVRHVAGLRHGDAAKHQRDGRSDDDKNPHIYPYVFSESALNKIKLSFSF